MATLLLVDSRIPQYSEFVAAVKSDVDIVPFNSATDTLDGVLASISAIAAGRQFSTVGIVQEGTDIMVEYKIVQNQKPAAIDSIESWSDIQAFFTSLKATFGIQTIDLISCNLWNNPTFADSMTQLETRVGVNIRASTNLTGNLAQGGDWTQESDNVNIRNVYFTDAIAQFTHVLYKTIFRPSVISTNGTLASVVAWGNSSFGASIPSGKYIDMSRGVIAVYSNYSAFAALNADGTVVTWGDGSYGGDSSAVSSQLTDVSSIVSTNSAFAALKADGTVVTWGNSTAGGNSSAVSSQLTGVSSVFSTGSAFAALKTNGTVVTWGNSTSGGDSSSVSSQLTDVSSIVSNAYAFAAIKANGSVVTWGYSPYGGDSSAVSSQLTGVSSIVSNPYAFAALKSNGTVVTWGDAYAGSNSNAVSSQLTDVSSIFSTNTAFAALKTNGTVVTWGWGPSGGDSSAVSSQLTGVSSIVSSSYAFAAIKENGSVVTWGDAYAGGDSSAVSSQLTWVSSIVSTNYAFAALKSNRTVVTWGLAGEGGNSSAVSSQLTGVSSIFSTSNAFAALKTNGSVVTWGDAYGGGNSSDVSSQLTSSIIGVASTYTAFAALRTLDTIFISYNANGATSGAVPAYTVYPVGFSVAVAGAGDLVKTGYTFGGWNDGTATRSPGYSYSGIIDNITLTAVWNSITPPSGGGGGGGGGASAVCFLGNAPVLTPTGYRRIDSLAVGDMVRTADGRVVAIQNVKHQRILTPSSSVNPYVIPAGQFGATENLAISPRHCVAIPGRGMIEARELGLRQMSMRAAFDYYNLELPEWDNMVVAGVEVESLAPKKRVVMTAAQFRGLVAAKGIQTEADLAKLAQLVEMLADGRVAVSMVQNTRRA